MVLKKLKMDIANLVNQISDDEISRSTLSELYNTINIRRRIYFFKVLLIYIFIISLIIYYYWKNEQEKLYNLIFIFSSIPIIILLIYEIYTSIINPRYHYIKFISYLRLNTNDYLIKNNKLRIQEKLNEIHEVINDSNEVCPICLCNQNNNIKLNCSKNGYHGGCIDCITEWYQINNSCPECRQKIFEDDIFI